MEYMKNYSLWLKNVKDEELINELKQIEHNETELVNRFSNHLQFGTSGLRGIIGVGTNNINVYTMAKTTQGICNYLKQNFKNPSVVVAYDNRRYSKRFATLVSEIFAKNKIKVLLFDRLTPTPIVSYAVRKFNATLGVNVTSSHNSKIYNGYKVVNSVGAQIDSKQAALIIKEIVLVNEFKVETLPQEKAISEGLVTLLTQDVVNEYVKNSVNYLFDYEFDKSNFSVIYTPLNGTGKYPLLEGFKAIGVNNVFYPQAQIEPDENFTTVPNPNPELSTAFIESLKLSKQHKANIILATDPDCDRLGAMVRHKGKYIQLTGDQVGVILLDYILQIKQEKNELNKNSFLVTSVVSSILSELVATSYSVSTLKTLTGFKNIGNKMDSEIAKLNEKGLNGNDSFCFAYEESIGYVASNNIRDKDGIIPTLLLTVIAAKLANRNLTLVDYLDTIYKQIGYVLNLNYSFEFVGLEGINKIQKAVNNLRQNPPTQIGKNKVLKVIDYEDTKQTKLESQNFLEFVLENNAKVIVRPSGTEPKLKVYLTSNGKNKKLVNKQLKMLQKNINKLLF